MFLQFLDAYCSLYFEKWWVEGSGIVEDDGGRDRGEFRNEWLENSNESYICQAGCRMGERGLGIDRALLILFVCQGLGPPQTKTWRGNYVWWRVMTILCFWVIGPWVGWVWWLSRALQVIVMHMENRKPLDNSSLGKTISQQLLMQIIFKSSNKVHNVDINN